MHQLCTVHPENKCPLGSFRYPLPPSLPSWLLLPLPSFPLGAAMQSVLLSLRCRFVSGIASAAEVPSEARVWLVCRASPTCQINHSVIIKRDDFCPISFPIIPNAEIWIGVPLCCPCVTFINQHFLAFPHGIRSDSLGRGDF